MYIYVVMLLAPSGNINIVVDPLFGRFIPDINLVCAEGTLEKKKTTHHTPHTTFPLSQQR